ncbi:mycofactocin precursor MftA [Streptomyces sp. NPDC001443]
MADAPGSGPDDWRFIVDQTATTPADLRTQTAGLSAADPVDELIEADDLVEEVSIDGMCGVY